MYICCVTCTSMCCTYVVKKVESFRGLGQLMGVARKRTYARATDQQEECKTATNTNSCCTYI